MPIAEYTIPGMHVRDHLVPVPLDWRGRDGPVIELFAREVVDPARRRDEPAAAGLPAGRAGRQVAAPGAGRPALAGRGAENPPRHPARPARHRALDAHRSRHHGAVPRRRGRRRLSLRCSAPTRSSPTLEHVRKTLFGGKRWESLGQSYGGFLTLTYLSKAPEALAACYVAGGLAGLRPSADEVYRRTYPRAAAKTARFYKRYPDDVARVAALADLIAANDVRLPDGDRLTVQRLQTVGIDLGMAPGFENVHWLIDEAFSRRAGCPTTSSPLSWRLTSYDGGPLFAVLQESIYGHGRGATRWAAERIRAEHPEFDPAARPLLFTGEMMFPWMFDEIRLAAALPGRRRGAGRARGSTRSSTTPLGSPPTKFRSRAVVYHDDMYVDAGLSLDTAAARSATCTTG